MQQVLNRLARLQSKYQVELAEMAATNERIRSLIQGLQQVVSQDRYDDEIKKATLLLVENMMQDQLKVTRTANSLHRSMIDRHEMEVADANIPGC